MKKLFIILTLFSCAHDATVDCTAINAQYQDLVTKTLTEERAVQQDAEDRAKTTDPALIKKYTDDLYRHYDLMMKYQAQRDTLQKNKCIRL